MYGAQENLKFGKIKKKRKYTDEIKIGNKNFVCFTFVIFVIKKLSKSLNFKQVKKNQLYITN